MVKTACDECGSFDLVFFFSSRRRHTRFDCDWSSDVCSSDLTQRATWLLNRPTVRLRKVSMRGPFTYWRLGRSWGDKIGRAAGRGRGEISGGAASFKKKKNKGTRDRYRNIQDEQNSVYCHDTS